MPAERVSMRRVREILRLKHECRATDREIARSLSVARSTVALTLERVAAAGLRWPLASTLTDRVLEAMLYAGHGGQQGTRRKAEPDWAYVHHELRWPGVALMLLWEEYRQREQPAQRRPRHHALHLGKKRCPPRRLGVALKSHGRQRQLLHSPTHAHQSTPPNIIRSLQLTFAEVP